MPARGIAFAPRRRLRLLLGFALLAASAAAVAGPDASRADTYGQTLVYATKGTAQELVFRPVGLSFDRTNDRLYVLDFDANGDAPGSLASPSTAKRGAFIKQYNPDGGHRTGENIALKAALPSGFAPFFYLVGGIAVDRTGGRANLWVTLSRGDGTSDPGVLRKYALNASGPPTLVADYPLDASRGDIQDPGLVAVDPTDGSVYVAGDQSSSAGEATLLRKFSADGTLQTWAPSFCGPPSCASSGPFLQGITGLAVAPDGTVAVADYAGTGSAGGRVQRFAASGTQVVGPALTSAVAPFIAGSVAFGLTSDTVSVDYGTDGLGVGEFRFATGAWSRVRNFPLAGATATCQFAGPPALAVNSAGDIGATDVDNNASGLTRRVLRFGANGSGCGFPSGQTVADFTTSNLTPEVGDTVTFDAAPSAPADPAVPITELQWDLDGDAATGPGGFEETRPVTNDPASRRITKTYAAKGPVTVRLRVKTADNLLSPVDTQPITVLSKRPVASFVASTDSPTVGQAVTFDGSASSDSDGTVATYQWDFGTGTFEDAPNVTQRTFDSVGTRTVRLRVVDNDTRQSLVVSRQITVAAAPPPAVTATPTPVATMTPTPPPADTTDPAVTSAGPVRVAKSGTVSLSVTCPDTETQCAVQAAGTAPQPKKPKKKGKGKKSQKPKTLALGRGSATIQGGETATVSFKMPSAAFKALKKSGKLTATFTIRATDPAGNVGQVVRKVKLSAPKR